MKLTTSPINGTCISRTLTTSPINGTCISSVVTIALGIGVELKIHTDGKIEYNCSPDEAAELFLKSLNLQIDKKFCGERLAKETLYKKLHAIMDNIEGMTKEQIISYLQETEEDAHKSLTWAILNERKFE